MEWLARRTCSLHSSSYSKDRGFIQAQGNTCSFPGPLKGPNQFHLWGFLLCLRLESLCSSLSGPPRTSSRPTGRHSTPAPASKPADCHMAPVTLAALYHLSKAGLACFKLSVAFCLGWQS